MKQIDGQLTVIQETLTRDKAIDTVYNNTLGWCCPVCGGFSKFKNIKFCPGCGQKLNLMSLEEYNRRHK